MNISRKLLKPIGVGALALSVAACQTSPPPTTPATGNTHRVPTESLQPSRLGTDPDIMVETLAYRYCSTDQQQSVGWVATNMVGDLQSQVSSKQLRSGLPNPPSNTLFIFEEEDTGDHHGQEILSIKDHTGQEMVRVEESEQEFTDHRGRVEDETRAGSMVVNGGETFFTNNSWAWYVTDAYQTDVEPGQASTYFDPGQDAEPPFPTHARIKGQLTSGSPLYQVRPQERGRDRLAIFEGGSLPEGSGLDLDSARDRHDSELIGNIEFGPTDFSVGEGFTITGRGNKPLGTVVVFDEGQDQHRQPLEDVDRGHYQAPAGCDLSSEETSGYRRLTMAVYLEGDTSAEKMANFQELNILASLPIDATNEEWHRWSLVEEKLDLAHLALEGFEQKTPNARIAQLVGAVLAEEDDAAFADQVGRALGQNDLIPRRQPQQPRGKDCW